MWSKTLHGDLKDGAVILIVCEMTLVFQTLNLALNESILKGLSYINSGSHTSAKV
jgi:hypothetical protein